MYPKPIENYFAPTTLDAALKLLGEYSGGARLLSGGQSLMPLLKARGASARTIVDINRIPGLANIEHSNGELRLGAMMRHATVLRDPLIGSVCPLLQDAVRSIGDPQVRNRGTIAGSLVFADALSDIPVAAVALKANITAVGPAGQSRTLGIDEFFLAPRKTALGEDEIVREICIPDCTDNSGGAYIKHAHVSNGYALLSVGVQLMIDEGGNCTAAAVAIGGLESMPARAATAEGHLIESALDGRAIAQAAKAAAAEIAVDTDFRASAEYRRNLIEQYVGQMIERARQRAGGAS